MVFRPPMLLNPPVNPGSIDNFFPAAQTGQDLVNQATNKMTMEQMLQQAYPGTTFTPEQFERWGVSSTPIHGLKNEAFYPFLDEAAPKPLPTSSQIDTLGMRDVAKRWSGKSQRERETFTEEFMKLSPEVQQAILRDAPEIAEVLVPSVVGGGVGGVTSDLPTPNPLKGRGRGRGRGRGSKSNRYADLDEFASWAEGLQGGEGGEGASQQRRQGPVGRRGAPIGGIQMDPSELGSPRQIESLLPEEEGLGMPELEEDFLDDYITTEPSTLGYLGIGGAGAALLSLLIAAGIGGKKRKKRRYRITPGGVKKYY
jgi:hypothetical protein